MTGERDTRAETIGARLRRLRQEQGVSQRDLSSPGVTYAYISRIEAGARQPSVKALRTLARKLGVTPEYLETGSELPAVEQRELRLAELELRLRLDGETDELELRSLLEQATAAADPAATIRARILLGLSAANEGDQRATIEHLAEVLGSDLVRPSTRPDVFATLGQAYAAVGEPERAVALFEAALADVARSEPPNRSAEVRYTTYLSYALTDLGQVERARALVGDLWRRTERVDDNYTRIRLHWSLGRVALEDDRPLAALDDFRRAIALLETTEDEMHLARAHLACAEATLLADEDPTAALLHLAEAERLLSDTGNNAERAVLRRLQSSQALQIGALEKADRLAREAIELSEGIALEQGHAWLAAARARAAGQSPGTEEAFLEAIGALGEHGSERDHADALRAYGRFLREHGRNQDAMEVFERAAEAAAQRRGDRYGAYH